MEGIQPIICNTDILGNKKFRRVLLLHDRAFLQIVQAGIEPNYKDIRSISLK